MYRPGSNGECVIGEDVPREEFPPRKHSAQTRHGHGRMASTFQVSAPGTGKQFEGNREFSLGISEPMMARCRRSERRRYPSSPEQRVFRYSIKDDSRIGFCAYRVYRIAAKR